MHERGFAGPRDAGDDAQRTERQAQRHVLQVVLTGAGQDEVATSRAPRQRRGDRFAPREIACGERARRFAELVLRAAEDDLATALAGARPELDDVVGRLDERAVVLDDDDGVAGARELAAQIGQASGVAGVEPDRRLVENVERADELGAELVCQVDPLRLASRQRPRLAPECEIAEADAQQERQLGRQLAQDLAPDGGLPRRELQRLQRGRRALDRERGELGDREAGDLDGERRRLEARARAHRARRLRAVTREEHAHVQLVPVRLDLLEEAVDAGKLALALVD